MRSEKVKNQSVTDVLEAAKSRLRAFREAGIVSGSTTYQQNGDQLRVRVSALDESIEEGFDEIRSIAKSGQS